MVDPIGDHLRGFFYTSRFHILEDRIIYNNVILLDESSDFLRNDGEITVGVGHETTLDPLAGHIGLQEILKIGQPMWSRERIP
jgi:IMP dehydrogenase/GMP reductase